MRPQDRKLDRLPPPDWEHLQKYALAALPLDEQPVGIPVVAGINWYVEFDRPVRDNGTNKWWIAKDGKMTTRRGGHCVCLKPGRVDDPPAWWNFYNQGSEGACVGFGSARTMSLLNRKRYDAFWLYHQIQMFGGYVGQEGAYVRDAGGVLQNIGILRAGTAVPRLEDGISAYRWACGLDEVFRVLDNETANKYGAIPILNSWGRDYPHVVWMPGEVANQVLFKEDGEVMIVTDR